jgi:AAA domain-containing protein
MTTKWDRFTEFGARFTAEEPEAAPSEAIKHATIAEILAVDPEALQTTYIVTPWIPRASLCALSARAGAGKGKLAQDLTIARATGGTWLGLRIEPGPALFWSGEQGEREDFRVTQALCRGRDLHADAFRHHFEIVYDPALKFGHPTMVAYVTTRLREHPGLLIVIDSQRRAVDGDENDSVAADLFYRTVLMPLRAAGATVLTLAHPPKTSGQQKIVADENMIRGSGDWVAQLDSFMILRPVNRNRVDATSETITMRLVHVKPRSGPQADPRLVTMTVTQDLSPRVAFTLTGTDAPATTPADVAGATKAVAALFEEKKRLGQPAVLEANLGDYGRPARLEAIKALVAAGVIRGPLDKSERLKGERGNWFVFVKPLPAPEIVPDWVRDPGEDTDDV